MEEKRRRLLERARGRVSEAYSSPDHSIIQAINAYKEIEKIENIVYERLEEWFGMHFPEVKLNSHETFSKLIANIKNKEDITEEMIKDITGDGYKKVYNALKSESHAINFDENEGGTIKTLANTELMLIESQKSIESYIEKATKKIMPNVTYLIDCKIAAELLSKAGSLERLASLPASTVQLLGAEKALFKHLKFGGKPPKYGVLFKLPQLSTLSKKDRGRVARVYATKISIAARADAFSKRFIADKLKESLNSAVNKKR